MAGSSGPLEVIKDREYKRTDPTLSIGDFRVDAFEQLSINDLQKDLFKSGTMRMFAKTDSRQPFPALPSIVYCVRKQTADKEVSNVAYIEIISERADSKPTLLGVIGRLQKVFIQELNQKYVLVVGDAKTYQLLQAIRYEYKTQLEWLVPFPGDWHVLFTSESFNEAIC